MVKRDEVVQHGEREGVGASVGDGGPEDKGGELLAGEDEAGDRGGPMRLASSSAKGEK